MSSYCHPVSLFIIILIMVIILVTMSIISYYYKINTQNTTSINWGIGASVLIFAIIIIFLIFSCSYKSVYGNNL